MAIKALPKTTCSLNAGLIYRLSMAFEPNSGVRITAYFVNSTGIYNTPVLDGRREVFISVGSLSFVVMPIDYSISLAYGRRVMRVTFVDNTRLLDQYYVTLPGRGCGQNVIVLGSPMNIGLLNPRNDNERIQSFTQFQDYEYTFQAFAQEVNKVIAITIPTDIDRTITKGFTGTLREVLNTWCSFYGLAWYVEGAKINVINPATFSFNLPSNIPPSDALDYETSESIEECYDTTSSIYYNVQGGIAEVNQAAEEPSAEDENSPNANSANGVATADVDVAGGVITSIEVTDGGSGYTIAPSVVISGGGGAGGVATAIVENGVVTRIEIENEGYGYTSAPSIRLVGGARDRGSGPGSSGDGSSDEPGDSTKGKLYTNRATLYPIGYEFGLTQVMPDLRQVAAAMYGMSTWFLYNYFFNAANLSTECGWTPFANLAEVLTTQEAQAIDVLGGRGAAVNTTLMQQKFEAYQRYGQSIAGRYYLSKSRYNIDDDKTFSWFNTTNANIFDYTSDFADTLKTKIEFLFGDGNIDEEGFGNIVPSTTVNNFYPGINYVNNRMLWIDEGFPNLSDEFTLDSEVASSMDNLFDSLINGAEGSRSFNFDQVAAKIGARKFVAYFNESLPSAAFAILTGIDAKTELLRPRFGGVSVTGVKERDVISLKNAKEAKARKETLKSSNSTSGIPRGQASAGLGLNPSMSNNRPDRDPASGLPADTSTSYEFPPAIVSNTSYIKPLAEGSAVYYAKFSQCTSSESTPGTIKPIKRRFQIKDVSSDVPSPVSFSKISPQAYRLDRDLTAVNVVVDETVAKKFATSNTIPRWRTSFRTNYLIDGLGVNFFTQGLVAFDLEINDNGISASYTFGNDLLTVTDTPAAIEKLEREIKNSWIRNFNPPLLFPSL